MRETAKAPASSSAAASRSSMRALSTRNAAYAAYLYERLQRQGFLQRDCQRLVNQDRNYFAACMVALGDADAMVTGVTRNFSVALEDVRHCIDPKPGHRVMGVSLVLARGRTVLVADTAVTEMPSAEEIAEIAIEAARRRAQARLRAAARAARLLDLRPSAGRALRRACRRRCESSTSGASISNMTARWRPTSRSIRDLMAAYPFCRLSGPANVLIMPAFHSASISTKMLQELGGATVIGPMLVGLDRSVQIVPLSANDAQSSTWRRSRPINISG